MTNSRGSKTKINSGCKWSCSRCYKKCKNHPNPQRCRDICDCKIRCFDQWVNSADFNIMLPACCEDCELGFDIPTRSKRKKKNKQR